MFSPGNWFFSEVKLNVLTSNVWFRAGIKRSNRRYRTIQTSGVICRSEDSDLTCLSQRTALRSTQVTADRLVICISKTLGAQEHESRLTLARFHSAPHWCSTDIYKIPPLTLCNHLKDAFLGGEEGERFILTELATHTDLLWSFCVWRGFILDQHGSVCTCSAGKS